ncbi:hypothetical protein [Xylanimonas ulmi]|uniref:Uncharacterized protein n=1 Tax=Xylanimonas ulmi TaxID=228973 RepID=A0A4Q7M7Z9_9MICO|nr:hypothetical protein [Xylanibacterium ulmi]RZS62259.1 hypothetical protein EV386_2585 [Xylanibacterium ulmi]
MNEPHQPARPDVEPTFGRGPNRVSVPLTDVERGVLEEIAATWGVSVPVAARRLLLLAANVCVPSPGR